MCILLVLLLATLGVQGVSHDKVASNRAQKLRAKLGANDKVKVKTNTIATSSRALKRGLMSSPASSQQALPTSLIQAKSTVATKTTTTQKDDPTTSMADMSNWATSPTEVTATPLVDQPTGELPDDATPAQILQAYDDVSLRVGDLESGQRDAVWNRADIASAQDQAVRIIKSAQDSVSTEQTQQAAMLSTIEVSADKKDVKADSDSDKDAAEAEAESETEVEVEDDPCCTNADDGVARATSDANKKSLSDMQAQVTALTAQLTQAIAPPNVDPEAFNQENAAVLANIGAGTTGDGTTGGGGTGTGGDFGATGTPAQCNTHLNQNTLVGDPNIWNDVAQAQQDALNKLIQQVSPSFTTGMATDQKTLDASDQLVTDDAAQDKNFKSQLATSCSESTCDISASGGLIVEADTPDPILS